ncbi:MAG: bifunctional riboflavin kinase/FAD synthetase [Chloroflexi bacterium]|nr:bifunctional riboflavin kinase/FAD synthetase [Chloroflexota bacterium]
MTHVDSLQAIRLSQPAQVTIGVFDGVHAGHQHLIRELVARAHASGHITVVLTFFPHPAAILRGITGRYYLTSPDVRAEELKKLGVDVVITQRFDDEFRHIRAADYIDLLCRQIPMRELWVGKHFTLGYQREGTVAFLRELGARYGYSVHELELVTGDDQEAISSTRIRSLLEAGDVKAAAGLLGRPYSVRGEVVMGDQRGRTIGFPTANLAIWDEQLLPPFGVYAGYASFDDSTHPCVTNLGVRPTFDGQQLRVESHLIDYSGDLYGKTLTVSFVERLRGEIKFPSIDALVAQITADVATGRSVLKLSS